MAAIAMEMMKGAKHAYQPTLVPTFLRAGLVGDRGKAESVILGCETSGSALADAAAALLNTMHSSSVFINVSQVALRRDVASSSFWMRKRKGIDR